MDHRLRERLIKIHEQIDKLGVEEELFLNLKASKDAQFGLLYLNTTGSVAEREAKVYSSDTWTKFQTSLVMAEVGYNKAKRMLDLQMKAYDAEHLSYKIDNQAINRQGSQT